MREPYWSAIRGSVLTTFLGSKGNESNVYDITSRLPSGRRTDHCERLLDQQPAAKSWSPRSKDTPA